MEARQIKFRAWNIDHMVYEDKSTGHGKLTSGWILNNYSKVMQFTGLFDKNGKEIYESDLVKAKRGNTSLGDMNDLYEIVWHELYACFSYKCVKSDNPYRLGKIAESNSHPFFVSSSITEVIGNVFENANLTTGS